MDEEMEENNNDSNKKIIWRKEGFLEAIKLLLLEKNTLFESLVNKVDHYKDLRKLLYTILFQGKDISYNALNTMIDLGIVFGFLKNLDGKAVITNRIFEILLYNLFLSSTEVQNTEIYNVALDDKAQFIKNGHLDMECVLEKFIMHFYDLYGECSDNFIEEDGRRYFLLYLRP